MKINGGLLVPNQYAVAHYRAKYPKEPWIESGRKDKSILNQTIVNAGKDFFVFTLSCALGPGMQLIFRCFCLSRMCCDGFGGIKHIYESNGRLRRNGYGPRH